MRYLWLLLLTTIVFSTGMAYAAAPVIAKAGKYSVTLSSQPSPAVVGENLMIITVKDGEKPVTGAGVDVHIDMTSMPMPADAKATPGRTDGEYGATVNLSMAGSWKIDIAVQQMAGMKMAGDGTAHFLIQTGKGITAQSAGFTIPWFTIFAVLLLLAVILTLLFYRRIPAKQRGYLVGTLTLLIVLVATVAIVRKYRDPKTSTLIQSATMDMSTQAAPGTVAISAETVHSAPFQSSVTYTGTVVPDLEEDVYPRVTGRLVMMPFYPGDRIAPNQIVAKLDTTELAAKEAQALYGNMGAQQYISAANADLSTARAGKVKSEKVVDQATAQLLQVRAAARAADGAVKAARSEVNNARKMAQEADAAVISVQSGIEQANEAVIQAQSDVDSAQADVAYWNIEIAREKTLYAQGAISKEELDRETAQAATAQAKLKQMQAAVRTMQAGVTRAKQEYAQAQARQGASLDTIATAEARLEQAQAEQESAQGKISEAQAGVATAEADVRAATAGVNGAQAKVQVATTAEMQTKSTLTEASTIRGYTTIRSSYGGVVTARNIAPGVLVQPGMSILKIAKMDFVRLQANVSAADLAQIQRGQLITAHDVNSPERTITARITDIFPARDTTARTAIVEARIPNATYQLQPGQYLSMQINMDAAEESVLTVPTSALIVRDGQSSVFLAVNDGMQTLAKQSKVTIGRMSNDRTEILTGIKDGDQVITSGLSNLHDEDAVTVILHQQVKTPLATPMAAMQEKPAAPAPTHAAPAPPRKTAKSTTHATTGQPTSEASKWYHCPMHVDMESDKPGKCPKCGMDYVEFQKKL